LLLGKKGILSLIILILVGQTVKISLLVVAIIFNHLKPPTKNSPKKFLRKLLTNT